MEVYRDRLKRWLDASLAVLLLLGAGPLMGLIALGIRLTSHGPAIFAQRRLGREGREFICFKFRTMRRDAPPCRPTSAFPDASRYVTPLGRLLRSSSLDELPQLWNVLRGEMSLVGPRPLLALEEEVHRARRENGAWLLRPGMTGLAQIRGRDRLSDLRKAELDGVYASSLSPSNDLRILLGTVLAVICRRDLSESESILRRRHIR